MNAEQLVIEAQRVAEQAAPLASARADIARTLDALDARYFRLIADLTAEQHGPDARARALAVVFLIAMVQLADDLADAECSYLEQPERRGPTVQALLHTLAMQQLLRTGMPSARLDQLLSELLEVGAAQHDEVTRTAWHLTSYLALAQRINGKQFGVYFAILLEGGAEHSEGYATGAAFGTALHVVSDAQSDDARWLALSAADRKDAARIAVSSAEAALRARLPALEPHLQYLHGYASVLALR